MKREPGIPGWYCAHGLPKGFEASVFRARGWAPLEGTRTYKSMVELAGYTVESGHDERGDLWIWTPAPLARLIPSGAEMRTRAFMCVQLGALAVDDRATALIAVDAATRLVGPEDGIRAVFGACETSAELHEAWRRARTWDTERRRR